MQYLFEHKFYGKSNSDAIDWINSKSDRKFAFIDIETTGLPNKEYNVQITQIACLICQYNQNTGKFKEVESFNKKIKLTEETISSMGETDRIKKVLSFNRYGQRGIVFHEESNTILELKEFLFQHGFPILVIQNASFDMKYLNTRSEHKIPNEVLDTKQMLQLFYLPTLQKLAETDNIYKEMIDRIGTSERDNGLISSSMGKVGPAMGMDMGDYHDALSDCKYTVKILENMIQLLKDNKDLDISRYHAERINKIRKK